MTKFLAISDVPCINTGYGNVLRELLKVPVELGMEIQVIGWSYYGEPHDFPFKIHRTDKDDYFGKKIYTPIMNVFEPDIVFSLGDPWMIEWIGQMPVTDYTYWWSYFPIDGKPIPPSWYGLIDRMDRAMVISKYAQNAVKEVLPRKRVDVLYHGVDTNIFKPLHPDVRKEMRKKNGFDDKFIVLCVARNQMRKNLPVLLKAFAKFARDKNDVLLLLRTAAIDIGWNLEELINKYKIQDKAKIIQSNPRIGIPIEQLASLYGMSDIFALPTMGEGFGIPLLESQACLPREEKIETIKGKMEIAEINVGDLVLGHDGYYHKVNKTFINNYNDELIKIYPYCLNMPVRLTKNHPVLTYNKTNKKFDWINAEDVDKNHYLVYPINKNISQNDTLKISDFINNIIVDEKDNIYYTSGNQYDKDYRGKFSDIKNTLKITPQLLELIGYYIAKGCNNDGDGLIFSFNTKETEYINHTINLIKEIFGVEAYSKIDADKPNVTNVFCYNKILNRLFTKFCGYGTKNKRIPNWVLLLSPELQIHILKTMWFGDSSIWSQNLSEELMQNILTILLRLKICPNIKQNKTSSFSVDVCGAYCDRLLELFKLENNSNRKKRSFNFTWFDDNFVYLPIRKIEREKFNGNVYNIQVESVATYVTSSFIVHNCGCPILATDCSNIPELVQSPKQKIKVLEQIVSNRNIEQAYADPKDLVQRLQYFYNNRTELASLGEKGVKFAQTMTWDIIRGQFKEMLINIIENEIPKKKSKKTLRLYRI